jgi:hypothetical protein
MEGKKKPAVSAKSSAEAAVGAGKPRRGRS